MINQLLKAIAPDIDPRDVVVTRDRVVWYKVIGGKLHIPHPNVLQANILELDRLIEALNVFKNLPQVEEEMFNWDRLELIPHPGIEDLRESIRVVGKNIVAVDIETKHIPFEGNKILSIGFAWGMSKCAGFVWDECDKAGIQELLRDPDITFIWHNGKFDIGRLKWCDNIDARVDEDTMLLHYARINERRGTHGLKTLGPLYLQAPQWDDELDRYIKDWARRNKCPLKDFTYDMLPMDVLMPYMQRDCIATLRLWHLFNLLARERPETEKVYRWLCEASNVFSEIERTGFRLDLDYMEDLEWSLEQKLNRAREAFESEVEKVWDPVEYVEDTGTKSYPSYFNIKSTPQLKWVLERATGAKLTSTDKEALDFLFENYENVDFIKALREVRVLSKQLDTYVLGFRERVCSDWRIRGTYNLHGTETGRLSSSDPNMQNIPREKSIKNLFIATPGKVLLQLDYSQAELRVLAHLAKDKTMTQLYKDDRDLHTEVTVAIHGPKEEWPPDARSWVKTVNFGIVYGRGPSTIASQLKISMSEARELMQKVMLYLSEARDWIAERRNMATRGDPCVTVFGRHRNFIMTDGTALNHIQNEYINPPVQSVASDLTLCSLLEIHKTLKRMGSSFRIIATVHDSIILEGYEKDLQEASSICRGVMASVPSELMENCEVLFKADAEWGHKWGEMEAL